MRWRHWCPSCRSPRSDVTPSAVMARRIYCWSKHRRSQPRRAIYPVLQPPSPRCRTGGLPTASPGTVELLVNVKNPTLTTASPAFVAAAARAAGWRRERWERRVTVPAVTLDQLIDRHGEPRFLKLDVEGFEAEALRGLSRPLRALSFEFTTPERGRAFAC